MPHRAVVLVLAAVLAVAGVCAPLAAAGGRSPGAAVAPAAPSAVSAALVVAPAARFRSRRPSGRRRAPGARHNPNLGRTGRRILRFLGIAFLLHALFGWGAGGSPLGLLIILALIAWLVLRRRRRPTYSRYG